MRIADLFERDRPVISFEFFPPRNDAGAAALLETIAELKQLNPGFVSVTWGAGGSTRRTTVELVRRIQDDIGLVAMAHLTCVGSSRTDLAQTLTALRAGRVENVLALGGDLPASYEPPADALSHADELIAFIRERWDFCLGAACYPETHPAAHSPEDDLRHLASKVRSGAEFLITQLFFDNRDYFAFVERVRSLGIGVPIVPGIMPIVSVASVRRMAQLSGAGIPQSLASQLESAEGDDARTLEIGVAWATRQCRELLDGGAPGLHFYTLNRSPATRRIWSRLFEPI